MDSGEGKCNDEHLSYLQGKSRGKYFIIRHIHNIWV
jgi:hypothetical protein